MDPCAACLWNNAQTAYRGVDSAAQSGHPDPDLLRGQWHSGIDDRMAWPQRPDETALLPFDEGDHRFIRLQRGTHLFSAGRASIVLRTLGARLQTNIIALAAGAQQASVARRPSNNLLGNR